VPDFNAITKHPVVEKLVEAMNFPGEGGLLLVGGVVRDFLLTGVVSNIDWDFAIQYPPSVVKQRLEHAGLPAYEIGGKFGTIGTDIDDEKVEITTFRAETYAKGSRKPAVEWVEHVFQDLERRDFTINAMAVTVCTGKLIDPWGGKKDLENKVIRAVNDPVARFKEDPLRILRMYRFAARYGYWIDGPTEEAAKKLVRHILSVSHKRWYMELSKMLLDYEGEQDQYHIWEDMFESGSVGSYILPEITATRELQQWGEYHDGMTVFEHTMKVVAGVSAWLPLRWAAFLHDIGKPATHTEEKWYDGFERGVVPEKPHKHTYELISHFYGHDEVGAMMAEGIFERFRFSNDYRDMIGRVIRHHLDPLNLARHGWTTRGLRRLVNRIHPHMNVLIAFAFADHEAHARHSQRTLEELTGIQNIWSTVMQDKKHVYTLPQKFGEAIMREFELEPSPAVGEHIDRVVEAILDDLLSTAPTEEEALEFLHQSVSYR